MDSISDTSEDFSGDEFDEEALNDLPGAGVNGEDVPGNQGGFMDFITSRSPQKNLQEYNGHALDFDGQESTHRLIRGLEGLFDELDYAVVDLAIGVFQKFRELTAGTASQEDQDGGIKTVD